MGEEAPDFELPRLTIASDAEGKPIGVIRENETIRLLSFRGRRPVRLIMSSYTCPPFTSRAAELERLYASYGNHIWFLIVYVREAHPEMLREGNRTGIVGRLAFQNVGDNPLALYYQEADVLQGVSIYDDDGHVLNATVREDARRAACVSTQGTDRRQSHALDRAGRSL